MGLEEELFYNLSRVISTFQELSPGYVNEKTTKQVTFKRAMDENLPSIHANTPDFRLCITYTRSEFLQLVCFYVFRFSVLDAELF